MRQITELLTILRDNTESRLGKGGLCSAVHSLYTDSIIVPFERELLIDFITKNRPEYIQNELFGWELGKVEPRINWLNEQIEKLMKAEFGNAERPLTPPEDDLEGVFGEIETDEVDINKSFQLIDSKRRIEIHKAKIEAYEMVTTQIEEMGYNTHHARLINAFIEGCIKGQMKLIEIEYNY